MKPRRTTNKALAALRAERPDQQGHAVLCASCGTTHAGFTPTQANHCAAEVSGNYLHGHYGSTLIDTEEWQFGARPPWVKDGIICDTCLRLLMYRGDIGFLRTLPGFTNASK